MDIVQICEIISGISAAVAIFISIVLYRHGLCRERKNDTIKNLSEIRRNYYNTKELDSDEKRDYLNELEFFSTGVNDGLYDIAIVNKMSGGRLISQYKDWAKEFIEIRRKRRRDVLAYCEYEKMINKLMIRRKGKELILNFPIIRPLKRLQGKWHVWVHKSLDI